MPIKSGIAIDSNSSFVYIYNYTYAVPVATAYSLKFVVKMLPERKRVLENRCKGTHLFPNFQIIPGFFRNFAPKLRNYDGNKEG
jgi:hypothetical protein